MLSINNYGACVSVYYEYGGMKTLGTRIKEAREGAGLSQSALGNAFGITREAVSLWESDKNAPTLDKLGLLLQQTGRTADWLLTGEDRVGGSAPEATLVGKVGAGAEINRFEHPDVLAGIPVPPGIGAVNAAIIEGDSQYPLLPGWAVFYGPENQGISDGCIGKLCVVQVQNGPLLLKTLKSSGRKNIWRLESWNAPPREDVKIDWASKVVDIRPD
jgi:transcriptional regulator with XRE-family HTH domain